MFQEASQFTKLIAVYIFLEPIFEKVALITRCLQTFLM